MRRRAALAGLVAGLPGGAAAFRTEPAAPAVAADYAAASCGPHPDLRATLLAAGVPEEAMAALLASLGTSLGTSLAACPRCGCNFPALDPR
jgi:hypothetical protein